MAGMRAALPPAELRALKRHYPIASGAAIRDGAGLKPRREWPGVPSAVESKKMGEKQMGSHAFAAGKTLETRGRTWA